MTREDLEHIIRASADLTDQYEFIIVGSQSILGAVPHPEEVFTMSAGADIYPLQAPELAGRIDGAIGEGSQFHKTHGYYAQGVGPDTAILPEGWLQRVHRVQNSNTNGRVGYCLSVADLFMSKPAAGRGKGRQFCMALLEHAYVPPGEGLRLVPHMPLGDEEKRKLRVAIRRWAKTLRSRARHPGGMRTGVGCLRPSSPHKVETNGEPRALLLGLRGALRGAQRWRGTRRLDRGRDWRSSSGIGTMTHHAHAVARVGQSPAGSAGCPRRA